MLNSQQSLTQPPQQGVKPAPGGVPPAIVAGPAVRIRHPNSISTTMGASALPAGTLGHAAAMVCMEWTSWNSLQCRHSYHNIYIYSLYLTELKQRVTNIDRTRRSSFGCWIPNLIVTLNRYMCMWKLGSLQHNKADKIH